MINELKRAGKVMQDAPIAKEGRMYYKDGKIHKVEKPKLTLGDLFPKMEK
jgi:hypothetical protein